METRDKEQSGKGGKCSKNLILTTIYGLACKINAVADLKDLQTGDPLTR